MLFSDPPSDRKVTVMLSPCSQSGLCTANVCAVEIAILYVIENEEFVSREVVSDVYGMAIGHTPKRFRPILADILDRK